MRRDETRRGGRSESEATYLLGRPAPRMAVLTVLRCAALLRGVNKKKLNKVREERITALHPAAPRKKAGDGEDGTLRPVLSGLVCYCSVALCL
jgi:hypothetical protein